MFYIMCPPTHFAVSYVINPWMNNNIDNVQHLLASKQWGTLAALVAKLSCVHAITPREGLPDMVFTANAGSKIGDKFFPSNFKNAERKPEEKHFTEWAKRCGYNVITLKNNFEGDGDFLFDPSKNLHFMGHGFRTDFGASNEIQSHTSCNIQPLKLVDDRFYHLDTCFCPLENGKVLAFMGAFHKESQKRLLEIYGNNIIEVSEDDAKNFACNSILINNNIIMPCDVNQETKDALLSCGLLINVVDLGEFMKAGGAAKCLTLRV